MKRLLAVLPLFALLGCATQPVPTSKAVPASHIYDETFFVQKEDTGKVVVKRDSGFAGAGCSISVFVDGTRVAALESSEAITVYLPVGKHIIGARSGGGLCDRKLMETEIDATLERPLTYRIAYDGAGHLGIYPTAF